MTDQPRLIFADKGDATPPGEAAKAVAAERKVAIASLGELLRMTRGITDVDFPVHKKGEAA